MAQTKIVPFDSSSVVEGGDLNLEVDFDYNNRIRLDLLNTNRIRFNINVGSGDYLYDSEQFNEAISLLSGGTNNVDFSNFSGISALGFVDNSAVTSLSITAIDGLYTFSLSSIQTYQSITTLNLIGESSLNKSNAINQLQFNSFQNISFQNLIFEDLFILSDFVEKLSGLNVSNSDFEAGIDYNSGAQWSSVVSNISIQPSSNFLTTNQVDDILIDMADSINVAVGARFINLAGNNDPRSSASDSAVTYLQGLGFTVTTN